MFKFRWYVGESPHVRPCKWERCRELHIEYKRRTCRRENCKHHIFFWVRPNDQHGRKITDLLQVLLETMNLLGDWVHCQPFILPINLILSILLKAPGAEGKLYGMEWKQIPKTILGGTELSGMPSTQICYNN